MRHARSAGCLALVALSATGWVLAAGSGHTRDDARNSAPADTAIAPPAQTAAAPRASTDSEAGTRAPALSLQSRELAGARASVRAFLADYVALLHGRGSSRTLANVVPALRRRLQRDRPRVTPAQQASHPHVGSVAVAASSPASTRAVATVRDTDGPPYPLVVYLERHKTGWVVTRIGDG